MPRSYRPVDRDQLFLMPPTLREWLPPEHLVWFVVATVEALDTSGFHARHPVAGPGRRAYDPDMLLAVLIYAYANGERSSRRIESLCAEHVAYQVVCGRDVPDHTVIARFRAAYEDLFAQVFAQVLQMCARAGMVRLGVIAIDGTKIAANASVFANRSEDSLRAEAERVAAQTMAEAAAVDAEEDQAYGQARGDEVAPEFTDPQTRAAAIKAALDQIDAERARQAAQEATRAESRAQGWSQRAEEAGKDLARVQAGLVARAQAWDTGHAAARAHGGPCPRGRRPDPEGCVVARARERVARLADRAAAAAAGAGTQTMAKARLRANLTDPDSRVMNTRTGWIQGYNAQLAVTDDHLILAVVVTQDPNDMAQFVPMLAAATAAVATLTTPTTGPAAGPADLADPAEPVIGLVLADAGYCSQHNLETPGPDRLIATGKDRRLKEEAAHDPRTGPPPVDASALEQMRHRMRTPEGIAAYQRRGATVEPVNGHLKDQTGLRRFSRRGLPAATSELNLAAAVVNLLKLHRHQAATAT